MTAIQQRQFPGSLNKALPEHIREAAGASEAGDPSQYAISKVNAMPQLGVKIPCSRICFARGLRGGTFDHNLSSPFNCLQCGCCWLEANKEQKSGPRGSLASGTCNKGTKLAWEKQLSDFMAVVDSEDPVAVQHPYAL